VSRIPEPAAGDGRSDEARRCIKCGREVGPDQAICEICNRAGMATPSATQYHGTIVVAIILGVVAMAAAASLSLRGVGPYSAEVTDFALAAPAGYEVTLRVTNDGTRSGRARCEVTAYDAAAERLRVHSVLVGPIDGGATTTFIERIPGLAEAPEEFTVRCS
jgi:hypothetical protein